MTAENEIYAKSLLPYRGLLKCIAANVEVIFNLNCLPTAPFGVVLSEDALVVLAEGLRRIDALIASRHRVRRRLDIIEWGVDVRAARAAAHAGKSSEVRASVNDNTHSLRWNSHIYVGVVGTVRHLQGNNGAASIAIIRFARLLYVL